MPHLAFSVWFFTQRLVRGDNKRSQMFSFCGGNLAQHERD
jgi:hypothetical protein